MFLKKLAEKSQLECVQQGEGGNVIQYEHIERALSVSAAI